MKILVADDNPVARVVLRAFLERSGYEPIVVEDGPEALKILTAPDGPSIVILDWMMPSMNGPEVCVKLRAAQLPIRPYVILLTAKTEKSDIVQGLDAGADEFITKPFNQVEMLARLRAAERVVRYEYELQQRIDELAAMVQRHEMLGDMIVHGKDAAKPANSVPTPEAPVPVQIAEPENKPGISTEEIGTVLQQAFSGLGFEQVVLSFSKEEGAYQRPPLLGWAGFYLSQAQQWYDLMLEADVAIAEKLFFHSMKRNAPNEKAQLDYLAEALTLIVASLKANVELRSEALITPYLSRGLKLGTLGSALPIAAGPREHCSLVLDGLNLGLTVLSSECPVKSKTAGQLNRSDILAEPLLPSESYQIPLINRGTLLNDRFIERLVSFAHTNGQSFNLRVFEPSKLAIRFNPVRSDRPLAED
jgi:CheY-like chemotaxis protein